MDKQVIADQAGERQDGKTFADWLKEADLADLDGLADQYVEWLERARPERYELLLFIEHTKDAGNPGAIETVYESGDDRARSEAVAAAVRRRERMKAQNCQPAACDEGGRWTRTSYGTVSQSPAPPPPQRTRSSGRAPREARNSRRRGSRRGERATASSSDDPDSDPEPAERRCQNRRCQADISQRHVLAHYCDDACQQQAYRDRQIVEHLDEIEGTVTTAISCHCHPRRGSDAQHKLVKHGHCWKCGRPRGSITRAWVDEVGVPRSRSFVVTRALPDRWKVRPTRKLSAKLRRTRGRWDMPAPREEVAA